MHLLIDYSLIWLSQLCRQQSMLTSVASLVNLAVRKSLASLMSKLDIITELVILTDLFSYY